MKKKNTLVMLITLMSFMTFAIPNTALACYNVMVIEFNEAYNEYQFNMDYCKTTFAWNRKYCYAEAEAVFNEAVDNIIADYFCCCCIEGLSCCGGNC